MINFLHKNFVCEIWAGVSFFSLQASEGSVYPNPPFKSNSRETFYNVNQYLNTVRLNLPKTKLVSHGLFHVDHADLQYDAQEMSIVSSCNLLGCDVFIPPFNRFNQTTESVCKHHLINLVKSYEEGWRSLEYEEFDLNHNLWYFHPWRFSVESFKHAFSRKQDVSA